MKEELKLVLLKLRPVLFFLIGLPLFSYGIWTVLPGKALDILIIDKTVPNKSYREHAGLFWTLNHLKYKKSSGDTYQIDQDYLGFFPSGQQDFGSVKDLRSHSPEEVRSLTKKNPT